MLPLSRCRTVVADVGLARLPVAGVDLEVGSFSGEPYLAAGVEGQFCDRCGCDVDQGGWLAVEIEPDAVGQQGEAGDPGGPGVAGAAGGGPLGADDDGGRADGDEYVAVLAVVGDDEGAACR